MKRNRYTEQEKLQMVNQVMAGEKSSVVGRSQGVHPNLLMRWVKEYREHQRFGNRTKMKREPEKLIDALVEIRHLTQKLQDKELEISVLRDLLKKSS